MTETEKAWAAGFLDGEGCICVGRHLPRGGWPSYSLVISVAQKRKGPLQWLQERWGGTIYRNSRGGIFVLQLGKRDGIPFLRDVLPYLMVKQEEALLAIEFGDLTHLGKNHYTVDVNSLVIREAYRQALSDAKRQEVLFS